MVGSLSNRQRAEPVVQLDPSAEPHKAGSNTVSIITVSFNSATTIRDTIESVLSQDYPAIEYIIVDGGSEDETLKIVREYGDRIDRVISEPDRGIYDAMNKGIVAASGDLVGTLNSDDFYADTTCVRQLVSRLEDADTDCVFADLVMVDPVNTDRIVRYYDSSAFRPPRLRYGWIPAHPTFLAKRSLYNRHGGYSLDYRIAADFEMMVRLLYRAEASYVHLPTVVVKMRSGGASTRSLGARWLLNREIVRACRANGLNTSLPRVLMKVPAKLMEHVRRPNNMAATDEY